jgi:DNA-binding SARP family transcriptional activator
MAQVRVLGTLTAHVAGVPAHLGGRRQRAVLARLLVARGSVVSTDRIIDDLWRGEPPARALTSLQAYVSNLRRALEPDRPRRSPARLLVTAPPGYAVRLDDDAVDAWQLENAVRSARSLETQAPADARDRLESALRRWDGPAYAEFADEPWAAPEAVRLEEVRRTAKESLVAATMRCGEPAQAVPLATRLVAEHPLREEGWRLLALALWCSNRSADALDTLRRARDEFATELGIDVAPALTELERAILEQRSAGFDAGFGLRADPSTRTAAREEAFVGRRTELAELLRAADDALDGRLGLVLLDGEAGIGKSSLLTLLARRLESRGWLVTAGRCPDDDGSPPAYAWTEALRALRPTDPSVLAFLDGDGAAPATDAAEGRFQLYRGITAWLVSTADAQPLAILLDDLHNADPETLSFLSHVVHAAAGTHVVVVASLRPADLGQDVRNALAAFATRSPARLSLAGLTASDVTALVTELHDAPVDPATVGAIAERTGGNPFYVKETVRLFATEGAAAALSDVPPGVREVIRRRLAGLPAATVAVLGLAAVAGLEADVDVIADAAGADDELVEALEAGAAAGLLREPAPGRVAFAHSLVRDTLYTDLPGSRRRRLHGHLAAALARARPHDDAVLAHHYARAAAAETAGLAVRHAVLAAERAERGHAHDSSVALLHQAVACLDLVPARESGDHDADRVALLGRLLRAQVRAGSVAEARASRGRAVEVAELAGREDLLLAAFTAWTEPTPWIARPYAAIDRRTVDGLARLLRRTDLEPSVRCRLLATYVTELAGEGDPSAARAATRAVELARGIGDPALLALALFEQARDLRWDRHTEQRAEIAAEIERIAGEHHLTAYGWRAQYISATAAAARGDVPALRRHLDRGLETARQYQMAEAIAVGISARAMLAHIAGRIDEAEQAYAEASTLLARSRSPHAVGFEALATVTLRASQGRLAELAPVAEHLVDAHGPAAVDAAAAALAAAGDLPRARALLADPPPLRPDFYFSVFASLRAGAATAIRRLDLADDLYAALLPSHDQLAGVASTSLAMRPVAHTLADLARLLGRTTAAEEHLAEAVAVAERWQAPVWRADARRALATLRTRQARRPGGSGPATRG